MFSIRKEHLRLVPTCWSITSHWWSDEQLHKLYLLCFFICFRPVGIVANYSKNFQIMYSDLLDKLQNTLSLKNCVELFKELFPTCWSTTSHWWSDEQLHKLYLLCFLFFSDMLELLQTMLSIRKKLLTLFPTCWSITSHWWRDEKLNKLYLLWFLFISDILEFLQTILKTFTLIQH